jgi:hypothetical protein
LNFEGWVAAVNTPSFLLWIFALEGIAALDKLAITCCVLQLAAAVARLERKTDWKAVEPITETFLWFESACDASGRGLWEEVE